MLSSTQSLTVTSMVSPYAVAMAPLVAAEEVLVAL